MSKWDELDMDRIVLEILQNAPSHQPGHHFGSPFLTSYQIAIEFSRDYPDEFGRLGKPVGGKGTGLRNSVAQYVARELSARIRDHRTTDIEGRFLWRGHLQSLEYDDQGTTVPTSLEDDWDMTMFRSLRP